MTDNKESALTFPCEFPIKVFGIQTDEFAIVVLELVQKHIPHVTQDATRTRPSQDGKYISVTILVPVESKAQLDAIYQELTGHPLVLMAL
jgi:putative lipoic acid-binding regulatory protein